MKQYPQHITLNYFGFCLPSSLCELCDDQELNFKKEIYYDDIS